jgi:iron complex outermembrane receptor protein
MKFIGKRQVLLASTMMAGLGLGGAAFAQGAGEVSEVVVTGSRIPQPNLTSASPVTVVGAEDIQTRGVTRTEDLVNQLPQVFAAQGSSYANGATGTATVDLRGLGPNRTLVLVDGRRLQNGTPGATAGNTAPDLNFIPSALIERVELVTGGASAVYGADAVAGVVNFIMQKDFEGVRLDLQYSGFQHKNESRVQDVIRARQAGALDPSQFPIPEETVWDGGTTDLNLVIGANTPDGRGNVTAYVGYRNVQAVTQDQRDYSACALGNFPTGPHQGFACGGSGTTAPGQFLPGGGTLPGLTLDPNAPDGQAFRPFSNRDAFNFAPTNYYQRPDERYVLGAFAHYELSERAEVYTS